MKKTAMRYTKIELAPGNVVLKLTAPWSGIPAGAMVRAISAGWNSVTDRHERTVSYQGRFVSGPF